VGRWRGRRLIYLREVELFEALKSVYPDLTPLSATDRADGITHDAYIEMKCRRTHYPTLLIEKKKWDYLADIRARTGARTLYINSTPQGIYQFDLGAINEPEWELKALPDKTDFANSGNVEKLCGFLDIRHSELLLV
jgi:hypothetical protein